MKIVYIHGLDSSLNSVKGMLLQQHCATHYPDLQIVRPDLNNSPDKVFDYLQSSVENMQANNEQVVLVGSSLGGYFSTLISNTTGCSALLLNPSTQPHLSLQRFVNAYGSHSDIAKNTQIDLNTVLYTTTGGWHLTLKDLEWFSQHQLTKVVYPKQVIAIIKSGDELLDPVIATELYRAQDVMVDLQKDGDHRMTDFQNQLPTVMDYILTLGSHIDS